MLLKCMKSSKMRFAQIHHVSEHEDLTHLMCQVQCMGGHIRANNANVSPNMRPKYSSPNSEPC